MTSFVAWMNGQLRPFSEMALPVWDLGVVAGASITEMARTFAHKPFRLAEHVERLMSSCRELKFETPYSTEQLITAAEQIATANTNLISAKDDLGIVIFVTAGSNRTYLGAGDLPGPTIGIHTFCLPFAIWKHSAQHGLRLAIPERTQPSTPSFPVTHKTRNRLHWWLADREAGEKISGSRALLLDDKGLVTETSTACFYGVANGQIVTPRNNVLDSMSRRMVKEAAEFFGIPFASMDIRPEEIPGMSEAFVSSTPVGVLPVCSIDNHEFQISHAGQVLPQLAEYWHHQTGIHPLRQIIDNS